MECPYCGTSLEEHEATECFDAWVVERVLGWERYISPTFEGRYAYLVGCYLYTVSESALVGRFSPSTDLVAAHPVWEKLTGQAKDELIASDLVYDPLAVCKKALEETA